ncbi:hypothetical protein HKBW3S03_01390, partial [Candidatus Hakubella thermalkaliphila]
MTNNGPSGPYQEYVGKDKVGDMEDKAKK